MQSILEVRICVLNTCDRGVILKCSSNSSHTNDQGAGAQYDALSAGKIKLRIFRLNQLRYVWLRATSGVRPIIVGRSNSDFRNPAFSLLDNAITWLPKPQGAPGGDCMSGAAFRV